MSGLGRAQCNQDVISMTAETLSRSSGAEIFRGPTDECDLVQDGECRFVDSAVVHGCAPCTGTWETDADFLIEFPAAFVLLDVPEGCEPRGRTECFAA